MTERDNQEVQETLAIERNSTSRERNAVLARNKKWCEPTPGKVKKNVSFKKDPKYCDPTTKLLRLLV